jgi:hypothetical protein
LALGTTWFFEQRRERREDARERAALKAAARIAYTDMGVIRRNLQQAVKEGRWYSFMEMPLSGWQQQGHRLAGSLPPQDYDRVAQAFARAGDLERGFRELLSSTAVAAVAGARVVPFSPNTELEQPVRDLLDQADESCQILGRLSYEGDDGEGEQDGVEGP